MRRIVSILLMVFCCCATKSHRDTIVRTPVIMVTETVYTVMINDEYLSVCILDDNNVEIGDEIEIEIRTWSDGSVDLLRILGPATD